MKPEVTIGVPVYNGEAHIGKTLEDLLAQDYPNLRIVISDNCSTDNTAAICRDVIGDAQNVYYHKQERNIGALGNFNQLLSQATAKYFAWAGHHDRRSKNFVSACVDALESNPTAVLAYPDTTRIGLDGELLEERCSPDRWSTVDLDVYERAKYILWKRKSCNMVYGLLRTDVAQSIATINPSPDTIYLVRLALRGAFCFVGDAVTLHAERPGKETIAEMWKRQAVAGDMPIPKYPSWNREFGILKAIATESNLPIRTRLSILDEAIWSFQMRNSRALTDENRFFGAMLFWLNWILAKFRAKDRHPSW